MSIQAAPTGGTSYLSSAWDGVKQKTTKAKDWVAGKFNDALDDVKTTTSKPLRIVKAIGYALVAVVSIALICVLFANIAYFFSYAAGAVLFSIIAIVSVIGIASCVKAAICATAAFKHNKPESTPAEETSPAKKSDSALKSDSTAGAGSAEKIDPSGEAAPVEEIDQSKKTAADTVSIDGTTEINTQETSANPATDQSLISHVDTQPADIEAGIEKSGVMSKIGNWFKAHWKEVLVVIAVVLVIVLLLVLSDGIFAIGTILLLVLGAGALFVMKGIEVIAGKIHGRIKESSDLSADKREIERQVNEKLEEFKKSSEYNDASEDGKKTLLQTKEAEFRAQIEPEIVSKRAHVNQLEEIKSMHGVPDDKAEEILKAKKEHDETLQTEIDRINDQEALSITQEAVEKKLKGGGNYHKRLKEAMHSNGGNVAGAAEQLRRADSAALDATKTAACQKRDEKINVEIEKIEHEYKLADCEDRELIAKQLILEKKRQKKWQIEQHARLSKAKGEKGHLVLGLSGINLAEQEIRAYTKSPQWDHLAEYKAALQAKLKEKGKLEDADIEKIRKDLRQKEQEIIDIGINAYVAERNHKTELGQVCDEINLQYGTDITPAKAEKEIKNKYVSTYSMRLKDALHASSNDGTPTEKYEAARVILATQDREILEKLAQDQQNEYSTHGKINNIITSYTLGAISEENRDIIARAMLTEIHRRDVWIKQKARKTGLSQTEIAKKINSECCETYPAQFKQKVEEKIKSGESAAEAIETARKEIYDKYEQLIDVELNKKK
ncbi:MAG: hypothetical protein LBD72_02295 [Puniceicoccales bacterium]|nr:hypothetical protein [Puniceicoccales bacterium]